MNYPTFRLKITVWNSGHIQARLWQYFSEQNSQINKFKLTEHDWSN